MKDIRVIQDGKMFKVMINFIMRSMYQTPQLANKLANEIKAKEFKDYNLTLISI